MPLQNRVTPFGDLLADPARGLFMGNRGGRIHADGRLLRRRWASKQWICCALEFKSRKRKVWGDNSYTELFFLDEVTALSAGHRPCFECRRADAVGFARAWERACGHSPRAAQMDAILHRERLDRREKRMHRRPIADLPDGSMIVMDGVAHAVRGDTLLRWAPHRYAKPLPRPWNIEVDVLTPLAIVGVLSVGYAPCWHESAGAC